MDFSVTLTFMSKLSRASKNNIKLKYYCKSKDNYLSRNPIKMGWYTNYEVEFKNYVDWDDGDVNRILESFDVQYLYLRDMDTFRVIFSLYSHHSIEDILANLKILYPVRMRYHIYNSDKWVDYA